MSRLRHDQRGIALPASIAILFISLLLVSAAALRAQGTTDTARRDLDSKRALQAAETGMRMAVFRTNAVSFDLSFLLANPANPLNLAEQCLARVSPGGALESVPIINTIFSANRRYCPGVTEDLGNGATVEYRVSSTVDLDLTAAGALLDRRIVAIGTAGRPGRQVKRRFGVEIQAPGTRSVGSLLALVQNHNLELFTLKNDSIRECRGSIPGPSDDPWTGC